MRGSEIEIKGGVTRRQNEVSLRELGIRYRFEPSLAETRNGGIGRSRVCQIEKSGNLTPAVSRAYANALRAVLAARRRKNRRLGILRICNSD
jgi:hypothetical protein